MSSHDSVRDQVVQQRGEPRLGDVVAFVLSVTVLVYALIDTVIGVLL